MSSPRSIRKLGPQRHQLSSSCVFSPSQPTSAGFGRLRRSRVRGKKERKVGNLFLGAYGTVYPQSIRQAVPVQGGLYKYYSTSVPYPQLEELEWMKQVGRLIKILEDGWATFSLCADTSAMYKASRKHDFGVSWIVIYRRSCLKCPPLRGV